MGEESKQEVNEKSSLPKACSCKGSCKDGCAAKKVLFVLGCVTLVGGILWLVIACPSCH